MHYFITSEENPTPSAIEIAQMQRVKLFNSLGVPAKIIETEYNMWHDSAYESLKSKKYVINMFQYYQKLRYRYPEDNDADLINKLMDKSGYEVLGECAYKDGKQRIQIVTSYGRLYSVNYYDRYGFMNKSDYYDDGVLSYTEYREDKNRIVTRQYYNNKGVPVIVMHYRGSENNVPVLTEIQLLDNGAWLDFDTIEDFRAHFFDEIVKQDDHAVLYADRSDYTLKAFTKMKEKCPRYMIFHSAVTNNGLSNGDIFDIYKPIEEMLKQGQLTGLVSSTKREAQDAGRLFKTEHSYAIPVTYKKDDIKHVSFSQRTPYSIIAVARLDAVKQLDHIIVAVQKLHQKYPQMVLKFYGYGDSSETPRLKKMVKDLNAEDYIKFEGYKQDLTDIYDHAWLEVLTSKFEGFAMALLESQEHGVCSISYDINYGPSEIIQDKASGVLLAPNDQVGLVKTIDELLSEPELIKQYSEQAYRGLDQYSFKNVAKTWKAFLHKENLIK